MHQDGGSVQPFGNAVPIKNKTQKPQVEHAHFQ
jgi:hypothetical protein